MECRYKFGVLLSVFVHALLLALQVSVYLLFDYAADCLAYGYTAQLYYSLGGLAAVLIVLYYLIRVAVKLSIGMLFGYFAFIAIIVASGAHVGRVFLDKHVYRDIALPERGVVLAGDELKWYELSGEKSFAVREVESADQGLKLDIIYKDGEYRRLETLSFREVRQLGDWELELKNYDNEARLNETGGVERYPADCTIICEQTMLSEDCGWSFVLMVGGLGLLCFLGSVYGIGKAWPQKASIVMYYVAGGLALYCWFNFNVGISKTGYAIAYVETVQEKSDHEKSLLSIELTSQDVNDSSFRILLRDGYGEEGVEKELLVGEKMRVGDVYFRVMEVARDGELLWVKSRVGIFPLLDAVVMSLCAALYLAMIGRYARCFDVTWIERARVRVKFAQEREKDS